MNRERFEGIEINLEPYRKELHEMIDNFSEEKLLYYNFFL